MLTLTDRHADETRKKLHENSNACQKGNPVLPFSLENFK